MQCGKQSQILSFNDTLLTETDLNSNLLGIIARFREKPIALSAEEIEEKLLKVDVKPADKNYLQF